MGRYAAGYALLRQVDPHLSQLPWERGTLLTRLARYMGLIPPGLHVRPGIQKQRRAQRVHVRQAASLRGWQQQQQPTIPLQAGSPGGTRTLWPHGMPALWIPLCTISGARVGQLAVWIHGAGTGNGGEPSGLGLLCNAHGRPATAGTCCMRPDATCHGSQTPSWPTSQLLTGSGLQLQAYVCIAAARGGRGEPLCCLPPT